MIKRLITLVCASLLAAFMVTSVAYAVKKKDDNFIKSSVFSSLPVLMDRDELSQLNQDLERSKQKVSTLENQVTSISEDSKKRQSELADENQKLKEKTAELEAKAQALEGQVVSLKAGYGGRGESTAPSTPIVVNNQQYTAGNSYSPGNCTWGVKNWNPRVPNFLGNANQWAANAAAMGIPVNSSPAVGAVAQTGAGGLGHVALVIGVNGDRVTIQEMNGAGGLGSVGVREVNKHEFVYIHV